MLQSSHFRKSVKLYETFYRGYFECLFLLRHTDALAPQTIAEAAEEQYKNTLKFQISIKKIVGRQICLAFEGQSIDSSEG